MRRNSRKKGNLTDDGWQVIEEHKSGQTEKEYIYSGQYIDDRICMVTEEGEFYYQTNNQFSVASMTDSIGEVVCRYFYSPYGEHVIEGEDHDNPYTYTGRRYESETGLHNFRFRWYSAAQGRFISRDPIGYWDGMNLYSYVRNKASQRVDAYGLAGRKYTMTQTLIDIAHDLLDIPRDVNAELDKIMADPEDCAVMGEAASGTGAPILVYLVNVVLIPPARWLSDLFPPRSCDIKKARSDSLWRNIVSVGGLPPVPTIDIKIPPLEEPVYLEMPDMISPSP